MIELHDVNYRYDDPHELRKTRTVLRQMNLKIREGEYVAVMGRNGSGKSTFARCLNGLLTPCDGEVRIDGISTSDATQLSSIRRKVGMVFQNPENQIVSTTVEREVAFGLENLGVPNETMQNIVPAMMERFKLTRYAKYPPHLLSGGEKQRLALAAVFAMNPKYLVLDEPTSMLDPGSRNELLEILTEIKSDNDNKNLEDQVTLILITQFPEEALEADRLIVFDNGRVLFDDAPGVVFQDVDKIKQIGLDVPVEFEVRQLFNELGLPTEVLDGFK